LGVASSGGVRRNRPALSCSDTRWRWLAWPDWSRRLTTALYFLALNWSLLAPDSSFEGIMDFLPHQDKIVHFALFLTLASLVRWSLPAPGSPGWGRFGCFAALLLYTVAIEALQPLLGGAGRQFDWLDMACNVAGAGSGWLLYGRTAGYHADGDAR
jgi:VanZ family protein